MIKSRLNVNKGTSKKARRLQLAAAILGLAIAVATSVYVWQRPVVADVDYSDCEISYGEIVAEWSGEGEDEWSQDGYRYQVRSFRVSAQSPGALRPRIIEAEPERIATGGELACREGFDEAVDPRADKYRWQGAVAEQIRLGYPEISSQRARLARSSVHAAHQELAVPVHVNSHDRAAVWVDDGGQGVIYNGDGQEDLEIYCVNYGGCGDITKQGGETAVRGEGFVFVDDNCPEGLSCGAGWYERKDLTGQIGSRVVGLKPFSLRLSAASTYAPVVGTEVLLTFVYPSRPDPRLSIESPSEPLSHNQLLAINGSITKPGPAVDSALVELDLDGQALSGEQSYRFDQSELDRLNSSGVLEFGFNQLRTTAVDERTCRELPVRAVLGYGEESFEVTAEYEYCVRPPSRHYTYSVATRGSVDSDPERFRELAAETLGHPQGWVRANIVFSYVESGGDFTLWLSSPAEMTSFSSFCSPEYSCRVGRDVIINDSRWRNGTPAWNRAGGSLRDYRHMVVNHEVGHFLGFGHYNCPSPGAPAPVMQQQSIDLQGCRFNPWPTPREISQL